MTTWFCSCGEVIEATEERQDAAVRHSRIGTKHVLTNYWVPPNQTRLPEVSFVAEEKARLHALYVERYGE